MIKKLIILTALLGSPSLFAHSRVTPLKDSIIALEAVLEAFNIKENQSIKIVSLRRLSSNKVKIEFDIVDAKHCYAFIYEITPGKNGMHYHAANPERAVCKKSNL